VQALLAIGAAALALPTSAANECKLEYGYHHTVNGLRKDEVATVEFDLGERKQIDRSKLNYVLNKKDQKVRVNLDGDALVMSEFDLTQNQRNPLALFYATPVTLDWAECRPNSPDQLALAMKAAGKTATQVALAMKSMLGYSVQQAAEGLKAAGYTASQAAAALAGAFNASAQQAAAALKAAGYTANQVAAGLVAAFSLGAQQLALALKAAGYTINQVTAGLFAATSATVQQVGEALKAAGYAAEQVVAALHAAGKSGAEVALLLKTTFDASAKYAAGWLGDAYGASVVQLVDWMQAAGYTLEQVAGAITQAAKLRDLVLALKQQFNATVDQIAVLIRNGTIPLSCGAAGCDQTARLLNEVFANPGLVLGALRREFNLSVQSAHEILTQTLRLTGQAVEQALAAAGYTGEQIAQVLGRTAGATIGAVGAGGAAVRGAADGAVASTMRVEYVSLGLGTVRQCGRYPADRFYDPVPLPPGTRDFRLTLLGNETLPLATAITGWPAGGTATIVQRGPCFLVVQLSSIPADAREGSTGRAIVMAGTQAGPGVNWRIGVPADPPRAPLVQVPRVTATSCPIHTRWNSTTRRCE
jgi:hypothetical protein